MLDAAESSPLSTSAAEPLDVLNRAIVFEEQGRHDVARGLMRIVADQVPDWDEPWLRIGQSHRGQGHIADAVAAYDAALLRNPDRFEARLARGVLALGQNNAAEAVNHLQRAVELGPLQHQAWHGLGYACAAMNLPVAAADAIATACRLAPDRFLYACDLIELQSHLPPDAAIDLPDWSPAVGLALASRAARASGALDEAIDLLQAALTLTPDDPDMLKQLSALYLATIRPEAAEPVLRHAHRLAPHDPAILNDLAVTLGRLYRFGEASIFMDMIGPDQQATPEMLFNRATLRASIGDFDGSQRDIEVAKASATDRRAALQAECALLPYRSGIDASTLRTAMTLLGQALPCEGAPLMGSHYNAPQSRDRRLRLGLLSHSLRQHPVGWLTFAGFKALDPARFALHCFGHYEPEDSFAPEFARHVEGWHDIDDMTDHAAATVIASQNIDLLFDLSGFGDGGRIGVTAYRPAPVQIKWVGSQASTTGIAAIDWMITDRWETPDGFEKFYTERLLRLADGYVCYTPPPIRTPVNALPALTNGFVTFGCFNNLAKLTDDSLRLWGRLLASLPDARLTLRCPQFSEATVLDRFIERARIMGLDPARMTLLGRAPHPVFIASYNEIDIAIDPCPYSGGLTTCEALFMGVPVITLAGDFFAARHSVSHLSNVGIEGCIATTPDDYIAKAVGLASDLGYLADLRSRLRERVLASPLCDTQRFGESLGNALRFTWHDYCDRLCDRLSDACAAPAPDPTADRLASA